MTNFTKRLMVAAATLVVAAGAASAQTMKAEIPFTFRANGALMAAGTYRITLSHMGSGVPILYILGVEGHDAALARAQAPYDAPKAWRAAGSPVLSFACGSKVCSLVGVWGGYDAPAYNFSAPKLGKDEPTRMALVEMRPEKGD
jgi:hypothetical protein